MSPNCGVTVIKVHLRTEASLGQSQPMTYKHPVIRSTICKLRIGNNKLNYYTGTKFNSSKLCSGCDLNTDETVKHIFLYCSKYSNYRNSFVNSLSSDIPWYSFDENKKLNLY